MKRKSSIFQQIMLPMLILVLILVGTILAMIWFSMSGNATERIHKANGESTKLLAKDIEGFLSEAYALSEELAVNPSIITMDTKIQTPILQSCVERNPYLELLYIQGVDGMQTGRSSGELADRGSRWWFLQMMETKKPFVSKSYYSVNTNMPCASVFLPIYDNDKMIGIMAADIKLDSLVELISEMSDEESGKFSYIIDGEGTVVAHPDQTYIQELYNYKTFTKTVSSKDENGNVVLDADGNIVTEEQNFEVSEDFAAVVADVMEGNNGDDIIQYEGEKYFVSYHTITTDGDSVPWSVITLQKYSTAMASTTNLMLFVLLVSIVILIVTLVIMATIAKHISKPISQLSLLITDAADGDFTLRAKENKGAELGKLSDSFNILVSKVSNILSGILGVIAGVESSKENLESIYEKAEHIVNEVQQISEGAANQEEDTQKVVELTKEMQQKYDELLQHSDSLMQETKAVVALYAEGGSRVDQLKAHSEVSLKDVEESYQKILQLNEFSEQVGHIVNQIDEISDQTSMLALNASIEAARAGEQGKGFAVVADEIGKLATNTQEATKVISGIMKQLQQEVSQTVEMVTNIKEGFSEQLGAVDSVKEAFRKFDESADLTTRSVNDMGELLTQMNQFNRSVVDAVNHIYHISQNTTNLSEGVVSVIEIQKNEIGLVTDKVSEVFKASEILSSDMSKFKVAEMKEEGKEESRSE